MLLSSVLIAATAWTFHSASLTGQGLVRIVYTFEGVRRENRCLYGEPPFDYGKVRGWLSDGMAVKMVGE